MPGAPPRLTITQESIRAFANLCGDDNPIHTDPAAAGDASFGAPVAHGMFLLGFARHEIERQHDRRALKVADVMFPNPAPVGSILTLDIHRETDDVIHIEMTTESGRVVLVGTITLSPDEVL